MEALGPIASIASGIMQMQMGKAQQQVYQLQAKQAEMQAKSAALAARADTLNYKREGIEVLKRVVENLATVNARAAANSVDPFSGSVANLAIYNLGKGVTNFYTSKENQEMSQLQGQIIEAGGAIQSAQYIGAGNMARRQGQIAMMSSFASAGGQAQQAGMFDPGFKFTNPFG